jgi:hypothetical protein
MGQAAKPLNGDTNLRFLVRDNDPRQWRFAEGPPATETSLTSGEVAVTVERFGFSANNITYALLGKSGFGNYFDFFASGEADWGQVPAWGVARIVASKQADVVVGQRYYGFLPIARSAVLRPATVDAHGFNVDRVAAPSIYNQYSLLSQDPYRASGEEAMVVLRPLYLTGVLLADFIAAMTSDGAADAIVISSAASKTSLALAFALAETPLRSCAVVGLTSKAHAEFAESVELYTRVIPYSDVAGSSWASDAVVFVDVAGDDQVRAAIAGHLGARLKMIIGVGLSHWDRAMHLLRAAGQPQPAGGPRQAVFSAGAWLDKHVRERGPEPVERWLAGGWERFVTCTSRWTRPVHCDGLDAVAAVYRSMLQGHSDPRASYVGSL